MIRRTITLPEELARDIDELVAAGAAPNVSRLLQEAARRYVTDLRAARLATEAAKLDPAEETELARGVVRRPSSPWRRLG